jgi:ribosome-binding factor A
VKQRTFAKRKNMRERLQEALRETAAEFLAREASRQSLITVTRATLSENSKSAVIFITVYPESEEEKALKFANRSVKEFADFFGTRVRGAATPHIAFAIDRGEKNRQRLDELS